MADIPWRFGRLTRYSQKVCVTVEETTLPGDHGG
jgi:hypothetical protein